MKKVKPKFDMTLEELCIIQIEKATKSEPVKAKVLRFLYGRGTGDWVHTRRIQEVIRELRLKGFPICANGDGYYYPTGQSELTKYIETVKGRVKELSTCLDALNANYGNVAINAESVIGAV